MCGSVNGRIEVDGVVVVNFAEGGRAVAGLMDSGIVDNARCLSNVCFQVKDGLGHASWYRVWLSSFARSQLEQAKAVQQESRAGRRIDLCGGTAVGQQQLVIRWL